MVGFESQVEGLVIRGRTHERNSGGDARGRLKSSNKDKTCRHYKKKWHIKCECYKLQNKNKRATANQKGKQLEKSDEASVAKYEYSERELLVVFYGNSKP